MSRGKLFFLILLFFHLNYASAQSDIAPFEAALDTARGEARYQVLANLVRTTPYRNPNRCLEVVAEALSLIKTFEWEHEKYLKEKNRLLGYKSHAFNNLDKEKESLAVLEEMFITADTICAKKVGPCRARGQVLSYLGNYYFRMKDFEKAVDYHRKSLKITRFVKEDIIPSCMNLGMAFEHSGFPDSALFYKRLGRNKLVEIGASQKFLTKADFEIALAYKAAEKMDSAEMFIESVVDTCEKYDFSLHRKAQLIEAEIKNVTGKYEQSWRALQACRPVIFESKTIQDQSNWYYQSSIATKGLGMLDSALYFKEQHVVYHDSIYEINRDESIEATEKSLEVTSKEAEIKGLNNRLGFQKMTLYALSFLLLLLTGGFLFYYLKNQKRREQSTLEIRYFLSGKPEIVSPLEIDPFLENVLKTIEENLSDPALNVESLAAKIFVSRSNLFKKVKALSGKTPVALIREIRMEKAKLLLETGEVSVGEAAVKTGYEDASYFARVFKKYFGKSPSEV